jgi:hypothetical protein
MRYPVPAVHLGWGSMSLTMTFVPAVRGRSQPGMSRLLPASPGHSRQDHRPLLPVAVVYVLRHDASPFTERGKTPPLPSSNRQHKLSSASLSASAPQMVGIPVPGGSRAVGRLPRSSGPPPGRGKGRPTTAPLRAAGSTLPASARHSAALPLSAGTMRATRNRVGRSMVSTA